MAAQPDSDLRDGRVLNMSLHSHHSMSSIYTVPITIGSPDNEATFRVQVDTGSGDLWVAADGCTTGCNSIPADHLYKPGNTARVTGTNFSIQYAVGSAAGPVYWDDVSLGPFHIGMQAFSAVNEIRDEAVSEDFVGILGLAMTESSIIASQIPVSPGGQGSPPDGQTVASNLWGITPVTQAPRNRFFGFLLERPDMPRDDMYIPSQFGIGAHPPFLNTYLPRIGMSFQPALEAYSTPVVALPSGRMPYWRTTLTFITAHTEQGDRAIALPSGHNGNFPTVVFDTGGSIILTTRAIANAIYGAYSVGPGSDGRYYVNCRTPLNFTWVFGTLPGIPIHPLDLTVPTNDPTQCEGIIQVADDLDAPTSPAEIVLGVPFLRNVYMALWRDGAPASPSIFPSSTRPTSTQNPNAIPTARAAMSLIPLTNITLATQQFNQIRILGAPLVPTNRTDTSLKVGHRLSLGIVILLAVVGLAVIVGVLFGIWWYTQKRRLTRRMAMDPMGLTAASGYGLAQTKSKSSQSEGEEKVFLDGASKRPRVGRIGSGGSASGSGTLRTDSEGTTLSWESYDGNSGDYSEFGKRGRPGKDIGALSANNRSVSGYQRQPEPWEIAEDDATTLIGFGARNTSKTRTGSASLERDGGEFPFPRTSSHIRTPSSGMDEGQELTVDGPQGGQGMPSPSIPLLSGERDRDSSADSDSPAPPLIADGRYPLPIPQSQPSATPPPFPRRGTANSNLGAIDLFGPGPPTLGTGSTGSRSYSNDRYPMPGPYPAMTPPRPSGSGYFQYDEDAPRERKGSSTGRDLIDIGSPPGLATSSKLPPPMPIPVPGAVTSSTSYPVASSSSSSSSPNPYNRERAMSVPSRQPEPTGNADEHGSGAATPIPSGSGQGPIQRPGHRHAHTMGGVGSRGVGVEMSSDGGVRSQTMGGKLPPLPPGAAAAAAFRYPPHQGGVNEFGATGPSS